MKVFAPKYYKEFKCIADKCTHSCCVGWEIDVDKETLKKYESSKGRYFDSIRNSLDLSDTPHIKLLSNEHCPHLDENRLCKIITECGEEYLCEICKEHPRFYNKTVKGLEAGLGMSCEEAARIILSSDDYAEYEVIDEADEEPFFDSFDATQKREEIYLILSDKKLNYSNKLEKIYNKYNVSPSKISDAGWREVISSLELLDEENRARFLAYSSDLKTPREYEKILERAFAYFVYRHTSDKSNEADFLAALGFACFMERLFASVLKAEKTNLSGSVLIGRIISEEIEYSEENTENIILEFQFV